MTREIRTPVETDIEALNNLRKVGFFQQNELTDEIRQRYLKRLPDTRCAFVDGQLASVITMLPMQMTLGNHTVSLGGLAGVQTAPEYRRQGHVRALLYDGFERLYENGTAWSMDHPFDPAYYERFGYKSVATGVMLELPASKLLSRNNPEAKRLTTNDLDALKPIRTDWERGHNLTIQRPANDWEKHLKQYWETRERTVYLLEDAYCIFDFVYGEAGEPNTLKVHDWAYRSPAGRANLLAFMGNFTGQAEVISLHLPADDPLAAEFICHTKPLHAVLQARVVSVKRALESLTSQRDSTFVLNVSDDFCAWNNSSYLVTMAAGKVTAEATIKSADVNLDVRALPLLLSGTVGAHTALAIGLLEGSTEHAQTLTSLAGGLTPFSPMSDFF